MTPFRVSFIDSDTKRRRRGVVRELVTLFGRVVAIVQVGDRLIQMKPESLKVLRGR